MLEGNLRELDTRAYTLYSKHERIRDSFKEILVRVSFYDQEGYRER